MVIPGRTYSVPPLYAQVVVMDSGTTSLPEWVSGEEAVLSNESSLIIATRPDEDGDVEMRICEPSSLQTGALIFDGVMDFPSGTSQLGNIPAAYIEEIRLVKNRGVHVKVLVEPPESPASVVVELEPGSISSAD